MVTHPSDDEKRFQLPYTDRHIPFEERNDAEIWPDDSRMAVMIELTPEQWEWDTVEPVDVHGSVTLPEQSEHSLSTQTSIKYAMDIGLPRLWEILEERDLTATAPATGNAAVQYPETIKQFHELGHEIICHSYSEGTPPALQSREEQRKDIRKTVNVIEDVTGEEPKGWLSPALLCNKDTIDILIEEKFHYHCDLQDDELPYFIEKDGSKLVEIPYRIIGGASDLAFYAEGDTRHSTDEALAYFKSVFDAYYREAAKRPQMFVYGIHPHASGRPDSSKVVADFLDYILKHDDIWVATFQEVANWWSNNLDASCVPKEHKV